MCQMRQKVSSIPKEEYQGFLDNNEQLAKMYGRNIQLFRKNKADIDFDRLDYDFVKLHETLENNDSGEQVLVTINNPYQLKIRPERQIAEVLRLSRSQVKNLLEKKEIEFKMVLPQVISIRINSSLFHMDK